MSRALCASACAALAIVGCGTGGDGSGSSAASAVSSRAGDGTGSAASTAASTATSTTTAGVGGSLTVSGSQSLSLNETANSANRCQSAQGQVSAILIFDAYDLQFSIPVGTTTFPAAAGKSLVAFFNGNDSTQEWAIGTTVAKDAAGTVTLGADGKHGTVDVDMLPNPPRPNPSLMPIHVKGDFTCP